MIKKAIIGLLAVFSFLAVFAATSFAVQPKELQRPHWDKREITVYIPRDSHNAQMTRAFAYWQRSLFNVVKFKYVKEEPANIVVKFSNRTNDSDVKLGSYNITTSGNTISKAEITIDTKSPEAKKVSNDYMYTTMLHEIGHVLGLQDSIRKPAGIMNIPITEEQDIKKIEVRKVFVINGWSFRERQ